MCGYFFPEKVSTHLFLIQSPVLGIMDFIPVFSKQPDGIRDKIRQPNCNLEYSIRFGGRDMKAFTVILAILFSHPAFGEHRDTLNGRGVIATPALKTVEIAPLRAQGTSGVINSISALKAIAASTAAPASQTAATPIQPIETKVPEIKSAQPQSSSGGGGGKDGGEQGGAGGTAQGQGKQGGGEQGQGKQEKAQQEKAQAQNNQGNNNNNNDNGINQTDVNNARAIGRVEGQLAALQDQLKKPSTPASAAQEPVKLTQDQIKTEIARIQALPEPDRKAAFDKLSANSEDAKTAVTEVQTPKPAEKAGEITEAPAPKTES